jgi:hypothetical protein
MALTTRAPMGSLLADDQIKLTGKATLNTSRGNTVKYTPGPEYAPPSKRSTPAPTKQTTSTASTSGGGAGAGGGGRGGPAPAAVATPPPPVLDLGAIRDALAAISANFRFKEGEMTAEQEAIQRALGYLTEQFAEGREAALTGLQSEAAGRGLLRSGLFLRAAGDTEEQFAREISRAQGDAGGRMAGIERNLANIKAQEQAQRANEARRLAQQQVGTQEAISRALQLV